MLVSVQGDKNDLFTDLKWKPVRMKRQSVSPKGGSDPGRCVPKRLFPISLVKSKK